MATILHSDADQRPSNRWLHVATAILLALSIAVQVVRDRGWQPYEPTTPVLWFQSGPLLKRVALGFDSLLADVYWIRAVVYYGGKRKAGEQNRNFELLDPMLTFVTTLDPDFKVAYRFGAIFLTEAYPSGPGRPDRAIALLERGLAANPGAWEYMHDIGFVHYWWLHDYKAAAEWFGRAGQLPGAPTWLPSLAATTLAQGGDRQSSRTLWRQLLQTGEGDWFRRSAQLRLMQLDAMDVLDVLNQASQRFQARVGRPPRTARELIQEAGLRNIPVDPSGVPFFMDGNGRIDVAKTSTLWPLPAEPALKPPAAK